MTLVESIKAGILQELAKRGRAPIEVDANDNCVLEQSCRAIAELVAAGLVREDEDDGGLVLVITRKGLEVAR